MDEYIGIVKLFTGTFAPRGWLFCNGQLLQIQQYSAVYAILGTQFGGDGITTFGLPNLQGNVPVGAGTLNNITYVQGEKGGNTKVTLLATNIPAHTHTGTGKISVSASNSTEQVPQEGNSFGAPGSMVSRVFTPTLGFVAATPTVNLASNITTGATVNTVPTEPVSVLQPYTAMNYIICIEGIFPPRP
ncbi:phage tail protein [Pseudomonas shirazensis]